MKLDVCAIKTFAVLSFAFLGNCSMFQIEFKRLRTLRNLIGCFIRSGDCDWLVIGWVKEVTGGKECEHMTS